MSDPFSGVPFVSLADPALNMTEEQLAEYREKRDPSLIVCKDGMRPTRYHLTAVRPAVIQRADNLPFGTERWCWYFRAGCVRIEKADGSVVEPDAKKAERLPGGARVAGDEWLDAAADAVGMDLVEVMGQIVWERSRLPKEKRAPL